MLERALAMSIEDSTAGTSGTSQAGPDFGAMTEDEQIEFALRMSMQDAVASRKFFFLMRIDMKVGYFGFRVKTMRLN